MTDPCHAPEKVAYLTKAAALEAWRGLRKADRDLNRGGKDRRSKGISPYRCDAGHWHLGRKSRRMREL